MVCYLVCSQPAAAGSCERHERPPVPVSRYHGVKGQTLDYICALPGKVRQGKENFTYLLVPEVHV